MTDWDLLMYGICVAIIMGCYYHGFRNGVKQGAAQLYENLYRQGTRKNDKVIVELEYEGRSETKEF